MIFFQLISKNTFAYSVFYKIHASPKLNHKFFVIFSFLIESLNNLWKQKLIFILWLLFNFRFLALNKSKCSICFFISTFKFFLKILKHDLRTFFYKDSLSLWIFILKFIKTQWNFNLMANNRKYMNFDPIWQFNIASVERVTKDYARMT
jgi:hypothetical protein